MTLTVNGQPANPGCYVEGHWGQYSGVHLLSQAESFDVDHESNFCVELSNIFQAWPKNEDGSQCGAYGSDRDEVTGPWAALITCGATDGQTAMELADEVLELLNSVTEGGYWEWYDGECFLRSYVCPECGTDARMRYDHGSERTEPCDFCCDADDPGCFA